MLKSIFINFSLSLSMHRRIPANSPFSFATIGASAKLYVNIDNKQVSTALRMSDARIIDTVRFRFDRILSAIWKWLVLSCRFPQQSSMLQYIVAPHPDRCHDNDDGIFVHLWMEVWFHSFTLKHSFHIRHSYQYLRAFNFRNAVLWRWHWYWQGQKLK